MKFDESFTARKDMLEASSHLLSYIKKIIRHYEHFSTSFESSESFYTLQIKTTFFTYGFDKSF